MPEELNKRKWHSFRVDKIRQRLRLSGNASWIKYAIICFVNRIVSSSFKPVRGIRSSGPRGRDGFAEWIYV